jgi:hypothetical protein
MSRSSTQRPWRHVPWRLWFFGAIALSLQLLWHAGQPAPSAVAQALPVPPSVAVARGLALGDPLALAKLTMLWLQAFDTQAGVRIALKSLDYARVIAWLELILELDPRAQYPLLAASRLYAEVPDPARSRVMLEFVHAAFAQDPARWPWLAHAVYLARHRLHDEALALRYARSLAQSPATGIPNWAKQLEIFVLENMGEIEAAKVLLGGLLASGKIIDPHELRFLSERLHQLELAAKPR